MTVNVETIQTFTADAFGVKTETMRQNSRARKYARPRQVAMYLCRDMTGRSLPEIGRQFGGRDHTTVLHACRVIPTLMAEDPSFRHEVEMLRARLTALRPSRDSFNVISLGEWLALARRVNVPIVPARFLTEARLEDLRNASAELEDGPVSNRLRRFFSTIYSLNVVDEMLRWDCCAPEGIKNAMAQGAATQPPPSVLTLDEPRLQDIMDALPPTQHSMTVWRRPWILPRIEGGYPVEYRVFVSDGKVIGVSNYYPQRVLQMTPLVDHEIKLATLYAEAMIAAQLQRLVNPQIVDAGLDPRQMHCTMDFIATPKGLLFLEGGPPTLEHWGAHPCCFEGRAIHGIALGPLPKVAA